MASFSARIDKLGINPYVSLPDEVLRRIFAQAGKENGPIPVHGSVNGKPFVQTLVKYRGAWRLYINGIMREAAGVGVGEDVQISIEVDPTPRTEPVHPRLEAALDSNQSAKLAFERLIPSRQKEILRYLNSMKTEEALDRNIERIMNRLLDEKTEVRRHITSHDK